MHLIGEAEGPALPRARQTAGTGATLHGLNSMLAVRVGMIGVVGNATQEFWPGISESALTSYVFTAPNSVSAGFLGA